MAGNRWVVFVVALIAWSALFYLMNRYIMTAQGLPVGIDLMPI